LIDTNASNTRFTTTSVKETVQTLSKLLGTEFIA
jgi:hypothetical protein